MTLTSMLEVAAVTRNREIRELIREPVQEKVREPKKAEKSSDNLAVGPSDAPDTQSSSQVTGKLLNVSV